MTKPSIGERSTKLRKRLESETHIWLLDLDGWQAASADWLLSAEEKLRARKMRHPAAQTSFVAGRALIRSTLSEYSTVAPTDWVFRSTRLGRPEILEPESSLRFNLAHTEGLAACVVTVGANCGVDVERVERPLRPLRIAEHSFAPEEFADLAERSDQDLRTRFFAYWTLKEAYYKARGSGIPFRLTGARFDFSETPGDPTIRFDPTPEEETDGSNWRFDLFRLGEDHLLALAVEGEAARRHDVHLFRSDSTEEVEIESILSTRPRFS